MDTSCCGIDLEFMSSGGWHDPGYLFFFRRDCRTITMASHALVRFPRSTSTIAHRCLLPSMGRLGTSAHPGCSGESRQDYRYAKLKGLVGQTRDIHLTRRNESTVLLAGLGVAAGALAARYGLIEYRKYQAAQQPTGTAGETEAQQGGQTPSDASGIFGAFGKRHYEGGFEEKMTRKEAALILGVRESAAAQRIKDSHRRILMINHPDKGGSKYMAAKINEAKEILLKGRE